MIAVETDPGYIFTRHRYELSKTEEEDLQKVLESLKEMFNADSASVEVESSYGPKSDYIIRISNGSTIGYILD